MNLNSNKNTNYVVRTDGEWNDMIKHLDISPITKPDFKEMAVGIVEGNGAKATLRCIVEEEKRIRIVFGITCPSEKNTYTIAVLRFKKSEKPVEFCKAKQ